MNRLLSTRLGTVASLALVLHATAEPGSGQCRTSIPAPDRDATKFGAAVALEGSLAAISAPDGSGSVYVVDVDTGLELYDLEAPTAAQKFGHSVAMDGGLLAVGAPKGATPRAYVVDLATGRQLTELLAPHPGSESTFGYDVDVDAGRVVVGDYGRQVVHVYDAFTGAELLRLRDPVQQDGTYFGLSLAIQGDRIAVGARGRAVVFDATAGEALYTFETSVLGTFEMTSVVVEGKHLLVGVDQTVYVLDLATGAVLHELFYKKASDAFFFLDARGDEAIVSNPAWNHAFVVNLKNGKKKHVLETPGSVHSVAIGEDRWLVGGPQGHPPEAYLFDVQDDDGDGYPNCQDLGVNYCGPAVPNSTGAPAVIAAGGSAGVAENDFRLRALSLPPHVPGYFLASRTQGYVPRPGGSVGNLCLGGSIGYLRSKTKDSGKNGEFAIVVPLSAIPPGMQGVLPGEDWNFQAWYRDGERQATSNFTDAVNVVFE